MKAGTLVEVIGDVIAAMEKRGYVDANGDFAKFDDLSADTGLATDVEGILKSHGVAVPAKLDEVIAIVPAVVKLLS